MTTDAVDAQTTITLESPCICGEQTADIRPNGPHYGAYCKTCGTLQRWVKKSELGLATRTISSRKAIKPKVRARIFDQFGNACMTCGRMAPDVILHIDHIIPIELAKQHGLYDELIESELNLAPSCEECNLGKGAVIFSARSIRLMYRCLQIAERKSS